MRVSRQWLSEFIELPEESPEALAASLASLGHEVEGIELLEPQFSGVIVARVTAIRSHPNADKIRLATVDFGSGELEVVCGAWNFEAGAVVAWAKPGSVLDGGFEVGEKEIRGVVSPGMIASVGQTTAQAGASPRSVRWAQKWHFSAVPEASSM